MEANARKQKATTRRSAIMLDPASAKRPTRRLSPRHEGTNTAKGRTMVTDVLGRSVVEASAGGVPGKAGAAIELYEGADHLYVNLHSPEFGECATGVYNDDPNVSVTITDLAVAEALANALLGAVHEARRIGLPATLAENRTPMVGQRRETFIREVLDATREGTSALEREQAIEQIAGRYVLAKSHAVVGPREGGKDGGH